MQIYGKVDSNVFASKEDAIRTNESSTGTSTAVTVADNASKRMMRFIARIQLDENGNPAQISTAGDRNLESDAPSIRCYGWDCV